jgi:pyruvate/2-oxoacid:ferredoxin oxidoreductase alpha subunit
MEFRFRQQEAMHRAAEVLDAVDAEWAALTGRAYGPVEGYRHENADLILVTSGTITSTARYVVNERRERGEQVGLVKVKAFRPFPAEELRRVLSGVPRVAVIDRNISPGHAGIFAEEIRSALYDVESGVRPRLFGYIAGLGGRDVTPAVIDEIIDRTLAADAPEPHDLWVGVHP